MRPGEVVQQAREAVDSGRVSLARDLLIDHVSGNHDPEALSLLGELLFGAGDLAGAGCVWFGTPARGEQVSQALLAWRQSHDGDLARMWRSLPEPVRKESRLAKVEALHAKAFPAPDGPAQADPAPAISLPPTPAQSSAPDPRPALVSPEAPTRRPLTASRERTRAASEKDRKSGPDAARIIAWALAAFFVFCAVVGLITILGWLVPGG